MFCKTPSCAMLDGMINTDHVVVRHARGSHQLGRFFHEVMT